METESKMFY